MELQLLSSHQIDKKQWNECLSASGNRMIYASSDYLDHMADNWDGIVGDDYDLIMPVPWRKKFGIKYCYDVPFIQQLGVFGKNVQQENLSACIGVLSTSVKYGDYALNFTNDSDQGGSCNNYILSLASNYRSTSAFYSDKLKSDLVKAEKNLLEYSHANAKEAIETFRELYAGKIPSVKTSDYTNFHELCKLKEKENNLIVRKICFNKQLLSVCLLFKDAYRLYNVMSCTTAEGRSKSAGHFLYDNIIKEFSQTGFILDLEGSEIAGVAHFYKSFGAMNQPYKKLHFNRLPFPLNIFKR